MDSPIPPDPYVALGVTKDADADAIKKAYRKLALKLHPDKCTDESQKAARTDEFTKIQQAYDIIGDEEKRGRYDAQIRLAELRRQNMEMRSAAGGRSASAYNVRTAAPRDAPREANYSSRAPPPRPAYDMPQPRARYSYDEDYEPMRGSTRKTSGNEEYAYVRRSEPREEKREKPRATTAPREEEKRRDAKRREAEIRASRSSKYEREEESDRRRRDYDSIRRQADASDSYGSSTEKITEDRIREAQKHMERQARPSMPRRESSRAVPQYHREASDPRRSAATSKEKERRRTSPSKDDSRRRENVDPYGDRRMPNLSSHTSAPPVVENMMPPPPHRSHTTSDYDSRKTKARGMSPPAQFTRSTTQPLETMAASGSSSKRRETKVRAAPEDSGYSSPAATPGYTAYAYPEQREAPPVSYSNGHRTVFREPSSSRNERSPVRASKGAMKMKGLDPSAKTSKRTQYSYPTGTPVVVEPKSSSSRRERERVRERDSDYTYERGRPSAQYFGEHGQDTIYPRGGHPSSPYEVNYAPHHTDADIRYTQPRFEKPSMQRSTTYVY